MLDAGRWSAKAALAVLVCGNAAVWGLRLDKSSVNAASQPLAVALTCGEWTGRETTVDPKAIAILETSDVVLREYHRGDEPAVWLARVGGVGQRAAFHPPELCYVGSHFEVLERSPVRVDIDRKTLRLMRLVIGQGKERAVAWYWFTAGSRITANYYQQQAWLLWDMLRGKPSIGSLVRLSTAYTGEPSTGEHLRAFLIAYQGCNR